MTAKTPIAKGILEAASASDGIYDSRRIRSQRDVIRDVMLAAADCDTWLTLAEIHFLTKSGEASISAQLRHLRKASNGGFAVRKRRRESLDSKAPHIDGRGQVLWEYQISKSVDC